VDSVLAPIFRGWASSGAARAQSGEAFTCPVGPEATAWWMSVRRCAENLAHAAVMDVSRADPERAWQLLVLRLSTREIIDTCSACYCVSRRGLVAFQPDPGVETVFGWRTTIILSGVLPHEGMLPGGWLSFGLLFRFFS